MYKAANLPAKKHIFLGAQGGVSKGIYASLNVSSASDDSPQDVQKNLQIAAGFLNLEAKHLHLLKQGITAKVAFVEQASHYQMEVDGVVTNKKDIVLCIRTADCAPVLLADYENGVIGAAHAGWRGAFLGVIQNVVDLMVQKGAKRENIAAAIGPCIGQESYEVDEAFYQQFFQENQEWRRFFKQAERVGHYLFDLEGFCEQRLQDSGVGNITCSRKDTYALENEYFSFRRNTHRGLVYAPKCFPVELSGIKL